MTRIELALSAWEAAANRSPLSIGSDAGPFEARALGPPRNQAVRQRCTDRLATDTAPDDMRLLAKNLTGALSDTLRAATSRGHRLDSRSTDHRLR
ncbi:hypothetical protein AB0G55_04315 [Streptomyces toyocaensis]|uniref:hypothetical protein n=1 Tax=Streptomyces toyocaensis TaxID=55952 RepID=UPI000564E351|nr:hypothetical protein [Streptomyces toyocaensis]